MMGELNEDVQALKTWLLKQPHLPQNIDDRLLLNFLFCCDDSLEYTKKTIELFFTFRADCPEIFSDRDPTSPRIQHIFSLIELCPLPSLTLEGYGCVVFRFVDPDPNKFNFYDFVKAFFMVGDVRARSETQVVKGLVPILDMTGWTLRHIAKAPILSVRKYIQYCQEAQPVKLRHIHLINASSLFDKMFAIIKPFVKSDIVAVLHLHPPGSEGLYKFVPKDILPLEYGGKAGTMKEITKDCLRKMEADREWFLKDEWMADDTKRVEKKTKSPGMEGSFRSLSID